MGLTRPHPDVSISFGVQKRIAESVGAWYNADSFGGSGMAQKAAQVLPARLALLAVDDEGSRYSALDGKGAVAAACPTACTHLEGRRGVNLERSPCRATSILK